MEKRAPKRVMVIIVGTVVVEVAVLVVIAVIIIEVGTVVVEVAILIAEDCTSTCILCETHNLNSMLLVKKLSYNLKEHKKETYLWRNARFLKES
jgi:hypothetical protein